MTLHSLCTVSTRSLFCADWLTVWHTKYWLQASLMVSPNGKLPYILFPRIHTYISRVNSPMTFHIRIPYIYSPADPHPGNVQCVEVVRDAWEDDRLESNSADLPLIADEMWHPCLLDYGLTARSQLLSTAMYLCWLAICVRPCGTCIVCSR